MKKNYPRYRNNIFVKAENHLTRTINTFIEYEAVRKIYLSFNFEKDKYELHLEIDKDILVLPEKFILIYDREFALLNKINMYNIFEILDTVDIREKFKTDDINKFKELVHKYSNKKTNFCDIFIKSPETIISSIQKFISIKGVYEHEQSGKEVNTNKMVAKRLYQYVLNRLNYNKEYFTKGVSLKNKIITNKISRKKFSENKLEEIRNKINILQENLNKDYYMHEIEGTMSYKDIIICLELFENSYFRLSKLTSLTTIDELLYEKALIEHNMNLYNEEIKIINKLNMNLKETIFNEFYDYIKIKTFFENFNKKEFTISKILAQLNSFTQKTEELNTIKGRKRKEGVLQLKQIFGNDFKKYYEKINELKKSENILEVENEKNKALMDYIYLVHKIDSLKDNLTIFNQNDIVKIFNGEYTPAIKLKSLLKKVITKEEIRREDNFYELSDAYLKKFQINNYKDDYETLSVIRELINKYDKILMHYYASDYLDKLMSEFYGDDYFNNYYNEEQIKQEQEIDFRENLRKESIPKFIKYIVLYGIKQWHSSITIIDKNTFSDFIFTNIKSKQLKKTKKIDIRLLEF